MTDFFLILLLAGKLCKQAMFLASWHVMCSLGPSPRVPVTMALQKPWREKSEARLGLRARLLPVAKV